MISESTEHRYGFIFMLISLILLIIMPPYWSGEERGLVISIIVTLSLLSFLMIVSNKPWERLIGIILSIPVLLEHWVVDISQTLSNVIIFFNILFYAFVIFELIRFALSRDEVDINIICAGISIYILMGVMWTFIYILSESFQPGSMGGRNIDNSEDIFASLLYFSFVTQSTLGFGDIIPLAEVTGSWVILQSIAGQFYLAIVVARLVSLYSTGSSNKST